MGKPGKIAGIEIDHAPGHAHPWVVHVVTETPDGERRRRQEIRKASLAEARTRQDELMEKHGVPGWNTLAAAKRETDEASIVELVAGGTPPDEAVARVAEWRAEIERMVN